MSVIQLGLHDLPPSSAHALQELFRPPTRVGMECFRTAVSACRSATLPLCLSFFAATFIGICVLLYVFVWLAAPLPHPPTGSEKCFKHVEPDGSISPEKQLHCWQERHDADKQMLKLNNEEPLRAEIEPPEVFLSVIVPAYNEENRLSKMLADAVNYLESTYPLSESSLPHTSFPPRSNSSKKLQASTPTARSRSNSRSRTGGPLPGGWEILIVSDGSTDATVDTALAFATSLPSDSPARAAIRVVALHRNRGKGGAVLHGLRHARGAYAVFADADGATRFRDVSKLLAVCRVGEDAQGRAVVVGSRAHLQKKKEKREKAKARSAQANGSAGEQGRRRSSSGSGGSDAVVERSWFRTFLMRSFHVFLWLLTPRATGRIRDTQCGFKLFSRAALRDIVPYMHCEGWIFDVEMLMLAEAAGIAVAEVPVTWREVLGSKLNVVRDSLGMAYGLGMLRAAWALGVYKRT